MWEQGEERSPSSRASFVRCLLTLAAEWLPSDRLLQEALLRAHAAADTAGAAVTGSGGSAGYQLGGRWDRGMLACLFSGAVFSTDWQGGLQGWSQEEVSAARDACKRMLKARRQVRREGTGGEEERRRGRRRGGGEKWREGEGEGGSGEGRH